MIDKRHLVTPVNLKTTATTAAQILVCVVTFIVIAILFAMAL